MEKDSLEDAIGFEMNNLKNFPFSRLPNGLQLEVIDELNAKEKMELFNVNSGFRGYFARNGPFGRHVDRIGTRLHGNWKEHQNNFDHEVSKKDRPHHPSNLSYNQIKLLLQKIRSCEHFYIRILFAAECYCLYTGDRLIELPLSDEEAKSYLVDCFRSLSMVSELGARHLEIPIIRKVLTTLRFEVTDWARLKFSMVDLSGEKDFSERAEFLKSYLEKQLKNCKKVLIIHRGEAEKVFEEIPDFQREEDPKKIEEIIEGFDKICLLEFPRNSEMKCFRRKIGEDEQGLVLTAKYAGDDDSYYDDSYWC